MRRHARRLTATYVSMCLPMCLCAYVPVSVPMCLSLCLCAYLCVYVPMCLRAYLCVYVPMCLCAYPCPYPFPCPSRATLAWGICTEGMSTAQEAHAACQGLHIVGCTRLHRLLLKRCFRSIL